MTINRIFSRALVAATIALALPAAGSPAFAAGGHGNGGAADIGKPGKASDVTRTINIVMKDNFYEPENLTLKEGETVRFVIKNEQPPRCISLISRK